MMDPRAITRTFEAAPADLRFASAVAGVGESLRRNPQARGVRMAEVARIAAAAAAGEDQREFVDLARRASVLQAQAGVEAVAFAR